MTIILRIIEVVLGLLALATISVVVFLRRPDWSPFQEQTFGSNVIPVATMVAAWTTLLVAYAAFRTIRSNREEEERDRKERLLNEVIEWALDVAKPKYALSLEHLTPGTGNEGDKLIARQLSLASNTDTLLVRGNYLAKITLIFTSSLKMAVDKVRDDLEKLNDLITDWVQGKDDNKAIVDDSIVNDIAPIIFG